MDEPRISVVIVSLGRPQALKRCLTGVSQLDYGPFEIVVVSDDEGMAAVSALPFAPEVRGVRFSEPNISRARNLGATAAGGEVLAFIDDDAVPEPTWLRYLAEAFEDEDVCAAVGYVRGRNGISFQSKAEAINRLGVTVAATAQHVAAAPDCPDGFVPKLIGTNMAVRRERLRELGGFDESFRFYLEDSDLSLRLAAANAKVVAVPAAEVHHSFAASVRRSTNRAPRTLTDIGRSLAQFLRKHASQDEVRSAMEEARSQERRRLLRHMVAGTLEPGDIPRILGKFDKGFEEGLSARIGQPSDIGEPAEFLRFAYRRPRDGHLVLSGTHRNRRALRAEAAQKVREGRRTTLFLFGPTTLFHRVRFTADGYWEQSGGTFGRSERDQPVFRTVSHAARISEEVRRVAKARGIDETA